MIVGEATIKVLMDTSGAEASVKAGVGGEMAGLGAVGGDVGGAAAGAEMRKGVDTELAATEEDVAASGGRMGEKLAGGMKGGLSKLGSVLGAVGLPVGNLGGTFDKTSGSVEKLSSESTGLMGSLSKVGGVATLALGVGLVAGTVALGKLGMEMQSTDAKLAASAGISVKSATAMGNAFLGTGGDAIVTGQQITTAYSSVAAQLATVQNHALSTKQGMQVMKASMDLSEASGESLGASTKSLASVMQIYSMTAGQAAKASDQIFTASRASGVGVDAFTAATTRLKTQLGVTAPSLGDTGALLVDMAAHNAKGSVAIRTLATAMTTLLKPTTAITKAQTDLKTAQAALPPSLDALAAKYAAGNSTAATFTKATKDLTTSQAAAWKAYTSSSDAVKTASSNVSNLGVTLTNSKGQFVGASSVVDQLSSKIKGMGQVQAVATLTQYVGQKAAEVLYKTIAAGGPAFDKARASVDKSGAAHAAAAIQSQTLSHQFDALKVEVIDTATKFGEVLLPKLIAVGKVFIDGAKFALDHKAVLIALGVVVGGVLTVAITAFAITTMGKLRKSFTDGLETVGKFGKGLVEKITAAFATTTDEAVTMTGGLDASMAEGQLAFEGLGTGSEVMAADVEGSAVAVDAAVGSTGIGAILIGLGLVVMLLATHWKLVWGYIKEAALDVWHVLDNDVVHPMENAWGSVQGAFDVFWNFVKKWGPLVAEAILAPFTGGMSLILPMIIQHWAEITSFFASVPGKIEGAFAGAATWLLKIGGDIIHGLWTGFELLTPLGEIIKWHNQIGDAFVGAKDWLIDIGKKIVDGLWSGMKAIWHDVTGWLGGLGGIIKSIKGPIEYDATLLVPHGNAIMGGLAVGLQEGFNKAVVPMLSGVAGKIAGTQFPGVNIGTGSNTGLGATALGGGSAVRGPSAAALGSGKQVSQQFVFNNVPTSDANAIMREAGWSMRTASE